MNAIDQHVDRQRRTVLQAMMAITAFGGLLFGSLNLVRGLTMAAVIEFAFVGFSIALLPVVGRTRHFRRWATAFVIPWTLAMLTILALPGASPSVFVWPLLLPLVLHFLLGSRLGLILSTSSLGAALLPATDARKATRLANRLRVAWRDRRDEHGPSAVSGLHTVSIGIATLGPDGSDLDTLLRSADQRLYQAKAMGRDRVMASASV